MDLKLKMDTSFQPKIENVVNMAVETNGSSTIADGSKKIFGKTELKFSETVKMYT